MNSFKDYLLTEMEAEQQAHLSDLDSHYRKVLQLLVKAGTNFEDRVAKKGQVLTELDMIEALDIMGTVIKDRLSTVDLNGEEFSPAEDEVFKGDEKRGFETMYSSIEKDVKSALVNYFQGIQPGEHERTGGFFVTKFNSLIVEPVIKMIKDADPETIPDLVDAIVRDGKEEIENVTAKVHSDDAKVARQLLQQYTRERSRRQTKIMNKRQRLAVIAAANDRVQAYNQTDDTERHDSDFM